MIFEQLNEQLGTLQNLLKKLTYVQYSYKSKHLGNYSIASHTRHIIELMQCVLIGYNCNCIDYLSRNRDLQLENDLQFALNSIELIIVNVVKEDKLLQLVTENAKDNNDKTITSTYYREILYNTEHTIHHLALIKVALFELDLQIVDKNFGMAYATIQYNDQKIVS